MSDVKLYFPKGESCFKIKTFLKFYIKKERYLKALDISYSYVTDLFFSL